MIRLFSLRFLLFRSAIGILMISDLYFPKGVCLSMRLFRLLTWDALFCVILTISYSASAAVTTSTLQYLVLLITCLICGVFLGQLPQRSDALVFLFVTLPALYVALAPLLSPFLTWLVDSLPLPFSIKLVPDVLLSQKTQNLRYACALVSGFTLFRTRK